MPKLELTFSKVTKSVNLQMKDAYIGTIGVLQNRQGYQKNLTIIFLLYIKFN